MEIQKRIKNDIKSQVLDTIGYKEAENKESFMVGHDVTFIKTSEYYEKIIEQQKKQIDLYINLNERYLTDLKTMTSIINKYSDND